MATIVRAECNYEGSAGSFTTASINTPLRVSEWAQALLAHPDQAFPCYVCCGPSEGFRIGFQRGSSLLPAGKNMQSAREHPEVVRKYFQNELFQGRMLGPIHSVRPTATSPHQLFGVFHQGRNMSKWRLKQVTIQFN